MTPPNPQTELETLRRRNVELRLQIEQYQSAIAKVRQESATWQQVAIAAVEKAKRLEEG